MIHFRLEREHLVLHLFDLALHDPIHMLQLLHVCAHFAHLPLESQVSRLESLVLLLELSYLKEGRFIVSHG